jgi:hypothetical protein
MATATLERPIRTETWTEDLTATETEALLDSLEVAGFSDLDVRFCESGLFAVKLPPNASHFRWPAAHATSHFQH